MTTTLKLKDAIDQHGIDVLDYLDREVDIPIISGLQAQGDVLVRPTPKAAEATTPVKWKGFPVVRGESGGNTHMLVAGIGSVAFYDPSPAAGTDPSDLDLGVLTVPAGSTAFLAHPEHGYSGIGAGTYTLRRQRERAAVNRFVQD